MKNGHRRMPAYGVREHGGKYVLEDFRWTRSHNRALSIRRWKRLLKKKARQKNRREIHGAMTSVRRGRDSGSGYI